MLREKEKDNVKMRIELAQIRKDNLELKKSDKEQSSNSDTELKKVKEKLREKMMESKR
jgi:hypothetical protein|tara:strand:+ start:1005 stop:1178 length:174 start_codon:yes stop_codon:yes gene_type:complete